MNKQEIDTHLERETQKVKYEARYNRENGGQKKRRAGGNNRKKKKRK